MMKCFTCVSLCFCVALRASASCPSVDDVLTSFQLADSELIIEPVAVEPAISDPVAMAFDARGRMFVVEMADFQVGDDGEDGRQLGRIRVLTDQDDDGLYETSQVFADGLTLPTANAVQLITAGK